MKRNYILGIMMAAVILTAYSAPALSYDAAKSWTSMGKGILFGYRDEFPKDGVIDSYQIANSNSYKVRVNFYLRYYSPDYNKYVYPNVQFVLGANGSGDTSPLSTISSDTEYYISKDYPLTVIPLR